MADRRSPLGWASTIASGVNNVGTSAGQVVGANLQRVGITFHNCGTVNVFVFPSSVATPPTGATPGGSYIVYPGSDVTIYGGNTGNSSAVNGAWQAFAASGSTNPLTILEMYE